MTKFQREPRMYLNGTERRSKGVPRLVKASRKCAIPRYSTAMAQNRRGWNSVNSWVWNPSIPRLPWPIFQLSDALPEAAASLRVENDR
jgi:hypothetical protein